MDKYLKYKQKYNELKQLISNGGSRETKSEQEQFPDPTVSVKDIDIIHKYIKNFRKELYTNPTTVNITEQYKLMIQIINCLYTKYSVFLLDN